MADDAKKNKLSAFFKKSEIDESGGISVPYIRGGLKGAVNHTLEMARAPRIAFDAAARVLMPSRYRAHQKISGSLGYTRNPDRPEAPSQRTVTVPADISAEQAKPVLKSIKRRMVSDWDLQVIWEGENGKRTIITEKPRLRFRGPQQ